AARIVQYPQTRDGNVVLALERRNQDIRIKVRPLLHTYAPRDFSSRRPESYPRRATSFRVQWRVYAMPKVFAPIRFVACCAGPDRKSLPRAFGTSTSPAPRGRRSKPRQQSLPIRFYPPFAGGDR